MPITKPHVSEYPSYYHTYIGKVTQTELITALTISSQNFVAFIQRIPEAKHNYRYADGKWSIKEVIAHIIDCERVFAYRALAFARNDKTELPGFDENAYGIETNAANRSMASMMEEYQHMRKSNILFFEGLREEMSLRRGKANGNEISVRALGFILPGHEIHHMQVIKERYLD